MRKHFLILMLMALLPMAGWAATSIADATFTINKESFSYTGAALAISSTTSTTKLVPTVTPKGVSTPLTYDTDYTLQFYDANEQPIASTNVKNAGNYFVAAVGKGDYVGTTTTKVAFQIKPADVTVTITADITKQYGNDTKPAVTFTLGTSGNVTIDGWLEGTDEQKAARNAAIVASLDFAWGTAEKTANANYDGDWYNSTTKGFKLTWSADPYNDNYAYKFEHAGGMKITPVNLSDAYGAAKLSLVATGYTKVNTAGTAGGYLYNGATQVPGYTITYTDPQNNAIVLQQSTGTTAATMKDFKVTYKWCATKDGEYADDGAANKRAGFYKPTIVGEGKNYKGSVPFPANFDGETAYYQIRKKGLYFGIADVNKVYDGVAFTEDNTTHAVDDVTIQPFGLVAVDNIDDNISSIQGATVAKRITGSAAFDENIGVWEVAPTVTWGDLSATIKTNYFEEETKNMNGFMTILPRPVTVTPKDLTDNIARPLTNFATLTFQNDDADAAGYYTGYVTLEEKDGDKGIAVASTAGTYADEVADILTGFKLALTEAHTHSGSWEKIIQVVPRPIESTDPLVLPYTGNYTIIVGENADYTIEGRSWGIFAKSVTLAYGQKVPENLEYSAVGLGGASFDDSGIKYIIKKVKISDGSSEVVAVPENGRLNVLPTGFRYEVSIDPTSVIVPPADYQAPTIDENPVLLTVNPKTIYACPAVVALNTGDTEADLNLLGKEKVLFLNSNAVATTPGAAEDAYTGTNALEEGDVISYKLTFGTGVHLTGGKITDATDVANGIKVILITDNTDPDYVANNANTNYDINLTKTVTLKIGGSTFVLDRTDAELLTKLQVADGKTYNVKFNNNRSLSAQQWAMMVLPFKTDVATISAAMKSRKSTWTELSPAYETGYAIVNVLNSASTPTDIRFELTMGELPANKPFLIKTSKAVNLNDVVFVDATIEDPAAEIVDGASFNGVTFKGLYTSKADLAADEMTIKGGKKYYEWTGINLKPFEAFVKGATAGARIYIEDIDDNGATAIKELNADTMKAYAVDGWYTLDGVKLNAAPAEKGVYINNGKKVVIK